MGELGDREKRAFIDQLSSVSAEFQSAPASSGKVRSLFRNPLPWLLAAAAILLLLILVFRPQEEAASAPMAKEQRDSIPENAPGLASEEPATEPSTPEETPPQKESLEVFPEEELIAAADPTDFTPNSYLDPLVNRNVRSEYPEVRGESSYQIQDSLLTILGWLEELPPNVESWGVFLYSNRDEDYLEGKALLIEPIQWRPDAKEEGKFIFSSSHAIALTPGRYYYFFADLEEEEPIWVGSLVIDP